MTRDPLELTVSIRKTRYDFRTSKMMFFFWIRNLSISSFHLASLVVSYDDTKDGGFMNANIQIQKKGTYLIDICGFHLDYMKGSFTQFKPNDSNYEIVESI